MKLIDKDGKSFDLWDTVWEHIQQNHPEMDLETLQKVLLDPELICKSNWDDQGFLYYKRVGKYYRVVVVENPQQRIKTALSTDKIKAGEIIWKKEL